MKFKDFSWSTGLFVIGYHLLLLTLLPLYLLNTLPSLGMLLVLGGLLIFSGLAITAGYHRLYAHNTYKLNTLIEGILLFFGTLATQNSAIKWSHDHRNHHRYADTPKDPYSIKEGFWHAHFLWILKKEKHSLDWNLVRDLEKNKLVLFQHKYYLSLMISSNTLIVALFGFLFQDYLGAFVLLFLTRLFLIHHATWLINSAAHYWGAKPYSGEQSAVNNWFISLFALGEGYHNYHHVFPSDYRNGVMWYQFDPSKFFIYTLQKIKLASNLKKMHTPLIKKRLLLEDKRLVLKKLKTAGQAKLQQLEEKVHRLSSRLQDNLSKIHTLAARYKALKQKRVMKSRLLQLQEEMKDLKKNIRADFKVWMKLCAFILSRKPFISAA